MTRPKTDQHEVARKLTEDALDAYVEGEEKKGDRLVDKAQQADLVRDN